MSCDASDHEERSSIERAHPARLVSRKLGCPWKTRFITSTILLGPPDIVLEAHANVGEGHVVVVVFRAENEPRLDLRLPVG